jgi:hypothetical protein
MVLLVDHRGAGLSGAEQHGAPGQRSAAVVDPGQIATDQVPLAQQEPDPGGHFGQVHPQGLPALQTHLAEHFAQALAELGRRPFLQAGHEGIADEVARQTHPAGDDHVRFGSRLLHPGAQSAHEMQRFEGCVGHGGLEDA